MKMMNTDNWNECVNMNVILGGFSPGLSEGQIGLPSFSVSTVSPAYCMTELQVLGFWLCFCSVDFSRGHG